MPVPKLNGSSQFLQYQADSLHEEWGFSDRTVIINVNVHSTFSDSYIPVLGTLDPTVSTVPNSYWALVVYSDLTWGFRYSVMGDTVTELRATSKLTLGEWEEIGVTKEYLTGDSYKIGLIRDGKLESSQEFSYDGLTENGNPVVIGGGKGAYLPASVANVYFWNQVLSAEELAWRSWHDFLSHKAELDRDGLLSHFSLSDEAGQISVFPNTLEAGDLGNNTQIAIITCSSPNGNGWTSDPDLTQLLPDYKVRIRPGWQIAPVLNGENEYIELKETIKPPARSGSISVSLSLDHYLMDELTYPPTSSSLVTGGFTETFDEHPLVTTDAWSKAEFNRATDAEQDGAGCFKYTWETNTARYQKQTSETGVSIDTTPWRRSFVLTKELMVECKIRASNRAFSDPRACRIFQLLTDMDTRDYPEKKPDNTYLTVYTDIRHGKLQTILQDINAGGELREIDGLTGGPRVDDNLWHTLKTYFKLNTWTNGSPNKDGIVRVWVDDELVYSKEDLDINRYDPNGKFSQFLLHPYAYAYPLDTEDNAEWNAPRDLMIDGLAVNSGRELVAKDPASTVPKVSWKKIYRWKDSLFLGDWFTVRSDVSLVDNTKLRITQTDKYGTARPWGHSERHQPIVVEKGKDYRVKVFLDKVSQTDRHRIQLGNRQGFTEYLAKGEFDQWHHFRATEPHLSVYVLVDSKHVGGYVQINDLIVEERVPVNETIHSTPPPRASDSIAWSAEGESANGTYDASTRATTTNGEAQSWANTYVEVATVSGKKYKANLHYKFNVNTFACSAVYVHDNNGGVFTELYADENILCIPEPGGSGEVIQTVEFTAQGSLTRIEGRIGGWPASTVVTGAVSLGTMQGVSESGSDAYEAGWLFSKDNAAGKTWTITPGPTDFMVEQDNGSAIKHPQNHPNSIGTFTWGFDELWNLGSSTYHHDADSDNISHKCRASMFVQNDDERNFIIDLPVSDATWEVEACFALPDWDTSNMLCILEDRNGNDLVFLNGGLSHHWFKDVTDYEDQLWDYDEFHRKKQVKVPGNRLVFRIGKTTDGAGVSPLAYIHVKRVS